jgi:nitroreductase
MLNHMPEGGDASHFQQILSDPNFDIFYQAPVLTVICNNVDSPWAIEDCSLAAENFMLAARGAGLGTCWIGFAQKWLGTQEGKAALRIPEAYVPVAPLILGHPASEPPAVPRKEPEIRWM